MKSDPREPALPGEFATAKPGNPIFCHEEFLEKLEQNRSNAVGRRAALLLQRLWVDERRQDYKSTQGANRGWRRSRLGGNHGSHFYAWWTVKGAPPVKELEDFAQAPPHAIFLRDIRHHDDHAEMRPQALAKCYLPLTIGDLRREEYVPAPWTPVQEKFAAARQATRVIKGYPGSGKTTALWHAADASVAQSILYITYSRDLASLARDYFEKFASRDRLFQVLTYPQLVARLLDRDAPAESDFEARVRFIREVSGMSPRILGPWAGSRGALYDEMHAHLIGSALPVAIGRFLPSSNSRLADRVYRERRDRAIGRAGAEAVIETANTLRKRDERNLEERFFPELRAAWDAGEALRSAGESGLSAHGLLDIDCIAIDEVQDLTPVEALLVVELASEILKHRRRAPIVLVAGDEAQTIRPTDFEWGWFQDLLHQRLGRPVEFKLAMNLRSPRRIANVVNRVWELYAYLDKQDRPGGFGQAEIDDEASDQIINCAATPGEDLDQLLIALTSREGTAVISLDDEIPKYVPQAARDHVLTVSEAKGLDFQGVCVLDGGRYLNTIATEASHRQDIDIEDLTRRLAIDKLRVAVSRPTDRLYWIDVNPNEKVLERSRTLLSEPLIPAAALIPAVVLKTLEEEVLDPEERVRLCENDARQFLEVKPAMAWSRAQQAITLLGRPGMEDTVQDSAVWSSAFRTMTQVAFSLAYRKASLGSELGRPDLFHHAANAAGFAGMTGLQDVISAIAEVERTGDPSLNGQIAALNALAAAREEVEPWLLLEIDAKARIWMERAEAGVKDPVLGRYLVDGMPVLYEMLHYPDAVERGIRWRQQVVKTLMRAKEFGPAREILLSTPEYDAKLLAACYEGEGNHRDAAAQFLIAGSPQDALRNFRSIPDFDRALEVIAGLKDHPAAESLLWLKQMRELAAQRPAEFSKVMLPSEKKLLEAVLGTALGVTRKKAAAKTAGEKMAAATKKVPAVKTAAVRKKAAKKIVRRQWRDDLF